MNPGSLVPQTSALTKLGHVPFALSDAQIIAQYQAPAATQSVAGPATCYRTRGRHSTVGTRYSSPRLDAIAARIR